VEIRSRKGNINQPMILLSGLTILTFSLLIFFLILRNIFGNFSVANLTPDFNLVWDMFSGKKPKVAILYSKYTENMLPEGSTWLKDNVSTWRKFLGETKTSFELIDDAVIENGKHLDYKIIILPGSKSLSDREIINLKKYLDNGGSIFATSGTASYSADGKWRGWDFFSEVFGVKYSREISGEELTKVHTIRGGLPLTAGVPTGFLLKVAAWDRPIAVEVLDPRTTQVSFWYNYRLQSGLVREEIKKTAGIIYGSYGKGRFVWMGFEPNSVMGVQEDYIYYDKIFKNSISWLSYAPIGFIKEWPEGYEAAAVIAPSFKRNIDNVGNMLDILSAERVPATFFVDESVVSKNKNIVRALSNYGEVAALVDIGYLASVDDTVNKLHDLNTQTGNLRKVKLSFEEVMKKPVNGLMPYNGLFDNNTIHALINSGYNYVMTDSLTDRSVPQAVTMAKERIVTMAKTARDDYEIIRDFGLFQSDFQYYTYQEDIDRILFEGGLYILKLHSDYQLRAENTAVVKDLIKDLKRKKFWIATAEEIGNWGKKKSYVDLRIDKRGESRVVVRISNSGSVEMERIVVQVELNEIAEGLALNSDIIGTKSAIFDYDKVSNTVYIHISNLKPGESRIYYLDYNKRNA
jgi:peptidoglycan/xylan/chitin deacetylase (PgdA/CDA1 family)